MVGVGILNRSLGLTAAQTRNARTTRLKKGMRNRARRKSMGGQGG